MNDTLLAFRTLSFELLIKHELAPGIAFEGSELSHSKLAIHLESDYGFPVGPLVEFAYDSEDYHVSLGLHIGFGL